MGAHLYVSAPEILYRDCEECRKYLFDKKGIIRDKTGKLLKRPEKVPVNCKVCQKYDEKTKTIWEGFRGKNRYYFQVFLIARNFRALPRAGGIDNQDPKTMTYLVMLNELFDRVNENKLEEIQAKSLANVLRVR